MTTARMSPACLVALALLLAGISRSVEVLSSSIHDRSSLQARLAHQATHDSLTGVPNRALMEDRLEQARGRLQRGTTSSITAESFSEVPLASSLSWPKVPA